MVKLRREDLIVIPQHLNSVVFIRKQRSLKIERCFPFFFKRVIVVIMKRVPRPFRAAHKGTIQQDGCGFATSPTLLHLFCVPRRLDHLEKINSLEI